jgi:hypothetical protein
MNVYYYYRKPDGSLGKLLDDSPEAIDDIDMEIERIKEYANTTRVLAVVQGCKNE